MAELNGRHSDPGIRDIQIVCTPTGMGSHDIGPADNSVFGFPAGKEQGWKRGIGPKGSMKLTHTKLRSSRVLLEGIKPSPANGPRDNARGEVYPRPVLNATAYRWSRACKERQKYNPLDVSGQIIYVLCFPIRRESR